MKFKQNGSMEAAMHYKRTITKDGAVEYQIEGTFQAFFWDRFKKQVELDIAEAKIAYFIFDLSETIKIDSMAISILVQTGKYNIARGKKLLLKNPPEHIKEIIRAADLQFIEFA